MASNLTSKRCTMFRSWQTPKIQDGKIVTASVTLAENRHMVLEKVNDEDELTPLAIPQRYLLREVVRASTAAPTFFRPQAVHITRLDSAASSDAQEYIDGGIMVNNASDLALMELMSKYPDSKCVIVTIGNGLFGKSLNEKVMGTEEVRTTIVTQLSDIIKAPMKGSEYRSIYTLKKLIDFANRRDPAHPVVHWIHINYIGEGITNSFSAMDNVKPDHIETFVNSAWKIYIHISTETLKRHYSLYLYHQMKVVIMHLDLLCVFKLKILFIDKSLIYII